MSNLESVVKRLEAIATRLEGVHSGLSSGAVPSIPSSAAEGAVHRTVAAYQDFFDESVVPFLGTCSVLGGDIAKLGELAEKGFKFVKTAVEAASECSKPSDDQLLKFVEPLANVIQEANAIRDNRSKAFHHQSGFSEAIQALQWIMVTPTPMGFVDGALESGDFYLNKVLAGAKDSENKEAQRNFVKHLKEALKGLKLYIKAHHTTGLSWTASGKPLSAFTGASAPAAPAAPSAPVAPPPAPPAAAPSSTGGGGMGAVFAQINSGHANLTSGLKKVTSDMKTKNRPKGERNAVVPSSVGSGAKRAPAKKTEKPRKPASTSLSQGKWFVENYVGAGVVTLSDDVKVSESLYVYRCENTTIQLTKKVKAICIDSCKKTKIVFADVVSTVEVVNCQSVEIATTGVAPSIAIDKTAGCQVWLNEATINADPSIITSNISEVNVRVPGATEQDDWGEVPIAEQFMTKISGKKGSFALKTTEVTHG